MTADPQISQLLESLADRLTTGEDFELEYKAARGGLPRSIWPTISSFANTRGGWIILGIAERDGGSLDIEGVGKPSQVVQQLSDLARNPKKISCPPWGADDITVITLGEKEIVVLRVPAAPRKQRPVYIEGNPYTGTYVRRNEGDYHCAKPEVDRMMREASDIGADSAVLPNFTPDDLDQAALARYRRRFQTVNPDSPWIGYDDQRFLRAIGGFRRDRESGMEGITFAGLLFFGLPDAIREVRKRHLIDYRLLEDEASAEARWLDRVAWEGNLLDAYEAIYPRLSANLPVPFVLRGDTRINESEVHVVLREALVNLLAHADYAETQASLVLRSSNGYFFRNPGSSRVLEADMLVGDRSDPRNPEIVRMFRHIGLAEEAGTGIPRIIRAWRNLGFRSPLIDTGTERYEFELQLSPIHMLSEDDRSWLQALGEPLALPEQLALVLARHGYVDNLSLRKLSGQHPSDATRTLVGLRDRSFLAMSGAKRGARYQLGSRVAGGMIFAESEISDEIGNSASDRHDISEDGEFLLGDRADISVDMKSAINEISEKAREERRLAPDVMANLVLDLCAVTALSAQELARLLGRSDDYVRSILRPLVSSGKLGFLHPERPTHREQRYVTVSASARAVAYEAPEQP